MEVHGEVAYGGSKTIDWFVVFPELTLLVEVKSRRMNTGDTADNPDLARKIAQIVGHANKQLARTHDLLESGHTAVKHVPTDRPMVGLVVTTEPLYLANSPWVRDHLDPLPFPTLTASMRDLENMVRLDSTTLAESLLSIANDPDLSTWYLTQSLAELNGAEWGPESPILTSAWDAYPWPDDPEPASGEVEVRGSAK